MKRLLLLLLILIGASAAKAQVLVTTFVDPCTKDVKLITVPLVGSTTVALYNKTKTFTAADVTSGALYQWINDAYLAWSSRNPCSTGQAATTATQVAANTVSSVVAGAISVPPPPPPPVAPPPPAPGPAPANSPPPAQGGGDPPPAAGGEAPKSESKSEGGGGGESKAESKSESKEESKSESKSSSKSSKSDSKAKAKAAAKAAKVANPMLLASDLTAGQNLDGSVQGIASFGLSQSSMAGDESWGVTTMVWSNLHQFAFNGRYTKMNFVDGKVRYINNFSYTWAYSYGTKMGVLGFAHIRPLDKWGVAGFNLSQIVIGIPHQFGVDSLGEAVYVNQSAILYSVTAFYTKPITLSKRINISPEMYITCNPYMFLTRDHMSIRDYTLNFLSGVSGDVSITKRFKFSTSLKASFSTNKQTPILFNILIGSKINL
jgi:hypothetical protein